MASSLKPEPSTAAGVLSPSVVGVEDGVSLVEPSPGGVDGGGVVGGGVVGGGVVGGVVVGGVVGGGVVGGGVVGVLVVVGVPVPGSGVGVGVPVEHPLTQSSAGAAPMPAADAVRSTAKRTAARRKLARRADFAADVSVMFSRSMHATVPGSARPVSESRTPAEERQRCAVLSGIMDDMIEALLWGFIGTVGIVGLILGLAAAFQLGRSAYRQH
jgi:hypothetical protein